MDPGMMEAASNMYAECPAGRPERTRSLVWPRLTRTRAHRTPEQAQAMLDQLSPEERAQVEAKQQQMKKGMLDLGHLATQLKPCAEDPDAEVTMLKVMLALATTPAMEQLGTDEEALLGPTKTQDEARAALSKVEDKLEEFEAFPVDALNDLSPVHWRNAVCLYWHLYKQKDEEWTEAQKDSLGEVDHWRGGANQIATKLLIQAQMLLPQQRWVQPTLTVARVSALVANALWSHTDPPALAKVNGGLPPPSCSSFARVPKSAQ